MVLRFQAFVRKAIYTLPGTLCTEWCLRYRYLYLPGYCMHIDVAPKGITVTVKPPFLPWKLEGTEPEFGVDGRSQCSILGYRRPYIGSNFSLCILNTPYFLEPLTSFLKKSFNFDLAETILSPFNRLCSSSPLL